MDSKVNDEFYEWLNKMYREHGDVSITCGFEHDYLGMTLRYKEDELEVNMTNYMKNMVSGFLEDIKENKFASTPAGTDLFEVGDSEPLDNEYRENFHTIVAKGLFACKRARPDIHTAIAYLCTRV